MVGVNSDALNRVFEYDVRHYLAGDILKKVDMTTMAWALEARAPLLDAEVAAIAMRMSPRCKIVNGETKKPLKDLLFRKVGREAEAHIARRKTGFGAPVSTWLSDNVMAEAVRDMLLGPSLRSEEWLDVMAARKVVTRFYSGRDYLAQPVWTLLALEVWARKYLGELNG